MNSEFKTPKSVLDCAKKLLSDPIAPIPRRVFQEILVSKQGLAKSKPQEAWSNGRMTVTIIATSANLVHALQGKGKVEVTLNKHDKTWRRVNEH